MPDKGFFIPVMRILTLLIGLSCLVRPFHGVLAVEIVGASGELPGTDEILRRVLDRIESSENGSTALLQYSRLLSIEKISKSGTVSEREARAYEPRTVDGRPYSKLISINGKSLSDSERQKEEKKERGFRDRMKGSDPDGEEPLITSTILDFYDWRLLHSTNLNERIAWVLEFVPRTDRSPSGSGPKERVLRNLAGILFVDAEDYEVSKVDVRLEGPVKIGWFGMFGSIQKMTMLLDSYRVADGVWHRKFQRTEIAGRQVLKRFHFRATEEFLDIELFSD
jgi:hypothetical protein